jgi:hypothetical protein
MTEWLVDPGVLGTRRANVLTAATTLEEILCRLRGRGNPPPLRCKSGNTGGPLEGTCRALWTITPRDQEAVDLLFNGRGGYRAAYSEGVSQGEEANRIALEFLSSWLCDCEGVSVRDSSMPLLGAGAKLWVPSDERINRALLDGRLCAPEVLVPTWVQAAELRTVIPTTKGPRYKPAAGILAPIASRVDVIGAWIRDRLAVDAQLKDRSKEIHLYGYT